jgi:hypothetical protein
LLVDWLNSKPVTFSPIIGSLMERETLQPALNFGAGTLSPDPWFMERETGFEPATSTLARLHSTTELFPHASFYNTKLHTSQRFVAETAVTG